MCEMPSIYPESFGATIFLRYLWLTHDQAFTVILQNKIFFR